MPVPVGDPRGETVTDDGRRHPVGATIRFRAALDPANSGVILRRRLDQEVFDQRATVRIDGIPAGTWATPYVNDLKRFADSDFAIAPALTAGKSEIEVEFSILPPVETPLVAGPAIDPPNELSLPTTRAGMEGGWTDFLYEVHSLGR